MTDTEIVPTATTATTTTLATTIEDTGAASYKISDDFTKGLEAMIGVSFTDPIIRRRLAEVPTDCFDATTADLVSMMLQPEFANGEVTKRMIRMACDAGGKSPIDQVAIMAKVTECNMRAVGIKGSEALFRMERLVKDAGAEAFKQGMTAACKRYAQNHNHVWFQQAIAALRTTTDTTPAVRLVSFDTIIPKRIEWLWPGRIPLGKVTLFAGGGGCNKSTVAYDLASRVSAGLNVPLSDTPMPKGKSLIVCGDDDPEDDIRPRLDVMGADVKNIYTLDIRAADKNGRPQSRTFDLSDLASLRAALTADKGIRVVIIDPVLSFLGKRKNNAAEDIYALIAPLNKLAAEFKVAIIVISHTNKGGKGDNSFRGRVTGAGAWVDATRSGFIFTKANDHEDRRIMAHGKINAARISKSLAFIVTAVPHPTTAGSAIRIDWEGEIDVTADQALAEATDGEREKLNDAVEFLRRQQGQLYSDALVAEAEKLGISRRTLWRAKDKLQIRAHKMAFKGQWIWDCGGAANPNPEDNQQPNNDVDDRPF